MFKVHKVTTLDLAVMYGSVALLLYGTFHIGKLLGEDKIRAEIGKVCEELKDEIGVE